jgi:hypothetical protein
MLGCARYGSRKKRARTRYTELVFFNLVQFAGLVVRSGASGAQDVDALFFMLGLVWYGSHKMGVGIRYAELVFLLLVQSAAHVVLKDQGTGPKRGVGGGGLNGSLIKFFCKN